MLQSDPVLRPHQHYRDIPDFLRLYERQRLKQLVKRSEAVQQHHVRQGQSTNIS